MTVGSAVGAVYSFLLRIFTVRDDADREQVASHALYTLLLSKCIILKLISEENRWGVSGSFVALLLGVWIRVLALILGECLSNVLNFDMASFFIYLFPPIYLNAGFSMKKIKFFENVIPIMLFGVVGFFISFAIISTGTWWLFPKLGLDSLSIRDILAIGVIFSSIDSVSTLQVLNQDEPSLLYSLVFGEGVVNDVTSSVLFQAIQTYNFDSLTPLEGFQIGGIFLDMFFLSCILGIGWGSISAYIMKTVYDNCRAYFKLVMLILITNVYLSYYLPEFFSLSGILSVFICGIVMSYYPWHNSFEHSETTLHSEDIFAAMSIVAESVIFLYVGTNALDIDKWRMNQSSFLESLGLFGSLMTLILLGRAAFVFPLSMLSNYITTSTGAKISGRQMIIIWWAGLMRGAFSIALAFQQFTMDGTGPSDPGSSALISLGFEPWFPLKDYFTTTGIRINSATIAYPSRGSSVWDRLKIHWSSIPFLQSHRLPQIFWYLTRTLLH